MFDTPDPLPEPTPANIRALRKARKWTQAQLAQLTHMTPRGVQMWEGGDRQMPVGLWELALIKAGPLPKNIFENP
jgi:putative transcriptional regulator